MGPVLESIKEKYSAVPSRQPRGIEPHRRSGAICIMAGGSDANNVVPQQHRANRVMLPRAGTIPTSNPTTAPTGAPIATPQVHPRYQLSNMTVAVIVPIVLAQTGVITSAKNR